MKRKAERQKTTHSGRIAHCEECGQRMRTADPNDVSTGEELIEAVLGRQEPWYSMVSLMAEEGSDFQALADEFLRIAREIGLNLIGDLKDDPKWEVVDAVEYYVDGIVFGGTLGDFPRRLREDIEAEVTTIPLEDNEKVTIQPKMYGNEVDGWSVLVAETPGGRPNLPVLTIHTDQVLDLLETHALDPVF